MGCSSLERFDTVILNGEVLDGSGKAANAADIGIRADTIALIADDLSSAEANTRVDAAGKTIVPGFVDIHSHAYDGLDDIENPKIDYRQARNLISQGITTLVTNHDGRQPFREGEPPTPISITEQAQLLTDHGIGPNVGLMLGHNTIRYRIMNDNGVQRPATEAEISRMKELIVQGMEAGAFGLSAGLEYFPGRWSTTEEVLALVEAVKPYDGVYIVHERSSGSDPMWYWPSQDAEYLATRTTVVDNIREVIEVARKTGVKTSATHVKVRGADYWGKSQEIIELIQTARAEGLDNLYLDQYPYSTTGSDGNTVLIPDWAFNPEGMEASLASLTPNQRINYAERLQQTLNNPANVVLLQQDIQREVERRGGAENILVLDHPDSSYVGKTLEELTQEFEKSPYEIALLLQYEGNPYREGGARLRGFSLQEDDVAAFSALPYTMTASDAGITARDENRPVHPRFFGTFPRKIKRYALDQSVLSVEEAVRSSTSLPANFMGISRRGLLQQGYYADLVVLDLNTIQDKAEALAPNQYSEGISEVMINGQWVVREGEFTENLPGRVLRLNNSNSPIQK